MSIPAEYLLPQDMVLLRDNETGDVASVHASDAKEALANGGNRYELVLPSRPARAASDRPMPDDVSYVAAAARAAKEKAETPPNRPPPPGDGGQQDGNLEGNG
jgi:hypothetical protein